MRITLKQVAEATGGELCGGDGTREISGVSTDSRTLQPAELFVALPGERFYAGRDHGDAMARLAGP